MVPEREEKGKGSEKMFEEIIGKNVPNMEKEIVIQEQEVQIIPYRINPRRNTPRHKLIKLTKIKYKEIILKTARERQQTAQKGIPKGYGLIFQQKLCRPKGSGRIDLN